MKIIKFFLIAIGLVVLLLYVALLILRATYSSMIRNPFETVDFPVNGKITKKNITAYITAYGKEEILNFYNVSPKLVSVGESFD